jgi:glucokinase
MAIESESPPSAQRKPLTALVADIGGTNARLAMADLATLQVSDAAHFRCADFPSLEAVVAEFLNEVSQRPAAAAVAVAAPVVGDTVRLTNSPWSLVHGELCTAVGVDTLLLLNDFEALAHALPHLGTADLHQIGGGEPVERATKAVLGPGTGLGVAGLAWSPAGWQALPSEGGHAAFAVEDATEFAMLERLLTGRERLSVERVVSGPGLADVYRVLAELQGRPAPPLEAAEVVKRAHAGDDPTAREALDRFATWLGRFAGDAALFFGARGGVYIGGGIAPRMVDVLSSGRFRRAFEAKGRMKAYLAPVPVYVILAGDAALKGAAAALATQMGHT